MKYKTATAFLCLLATLGVGCARPHENATFAEIQAVIDIVEAPVSSKDVQGFGVISLHDHWTSVYCRFRLSNKAVLTGTPVNLAAMHPVIFNEFSSRFRLGAEADWWDVKLAVGDTVYLVTDDAEIRTLMLVRTKPNSTDVYLVSRGHESGPLLSDHPYPESGMMASQMSATGIAFSKPQTDG